MSGSWAAGWTTSDVVTAAEFKKGVGCVFDSTLGVDAASFDITGIVSTYAALRIIASLRSDRAATTDNLKLRFNNDGGSNYQDAFVFNSSASAAAGGSDDGANGAFAGQVAAASAPASAFGPAEIVIADYANTARHKAFVFSSFAPGADATGVSLLAALGGGRWKSTAAVSRVTILPYFGTVWKAGSRLSIYAMGA